MTKFTQPKFTVTASDKAAQENYDRNYDRIFGRPAVDRRGGPPVAPPATGRRSGTPAARRRGK